MLSVGPIPQHSKPLCGMIISVKCHKQYFGKRLGACCCEQKYADLQFVPDDQTGVQFIFALSFLVFLVYFGNNQLFSLHEINVGLCCVMLTLNSRWYHSVILVFTSQKERGYVIENLRMMPILMCLYNKILTWTFISLYNWKTSAVKFYRWVGLVTTH